MFNALELLNEANVGPLSYDTDFLGLTIPTLEDPANVELLNNCVSNLENYMKNSTLDVLAYYNTETSELELKFDDVSPIIHSVGSTYLFSSPRNFTANQSLSIKIAGLDSKTCTVVTDIANGDVCLARLIESGVNFQLISFPNIFSALKSHIDERNNPHRVTLSQMCPYKVGDIFSTTLETDPSTTWTGTTWEMLPNDFMPLNTTGTNVKVTGGSRVITEANLPSHTHTGSFTGTAMAGHAHTFTGSNIADHGHTFAGTVLAGHTHGFTGGSIAAHSHTRGSMEIQGKSYTGDYNTTAGNRWWNATGGAFHRLTGASGPGINDTDEYEEQTSQVMFEASRTWTGSCQSVSAGTPTGTISSITAGTPTGTIVANSSGTPTGTVSTVSSGTASGTVSLVATGDNDDYVQPYYTLRFWLRLT